MSGEVIFIFINKSPDGRNNICGKTISLYRKKLGISQRELADRLQRAGLDIDKNAVQRIEAGLRFVTDIELCYISAVLRLPIDTLLSADEFRNETVSVGGS